MYFISSKSKYSNLRFIANKKDLSRPTQIHSLVWIFAVSIMATSGRKMSSSIPYVTLSIQTDRPGKTL